MTGADRARFYEDRKGDFSLWEPKPAKTDARRGGPWTVGFAAGGRRDGVALSEGTKAL